MLDRCRVFFCCLPRDGVSPVRTARILFLVCLVVVSGCGALGSGFVALLDPDGEQGLSSLDNAPGHVVVAFVNNTVVDERLVGYLESAEGGSLILSDAQKQSLRPLFRLRYQVNFTGGNQDPVVLGGDFVSGAAIVEEGFPAQANELSRLVWQDNTVHLCDVDSVEVELANTQVFMPVELTGYELIETTNAAGDVVGITFEARERTAPGFRTVEVDDVDDDGRVTVFRNVGTREVPSPVVNPRCGSVIVITVDGVLSAPFLAGVSDAPSFDRDDEQTIAGIGGRFRFRVSVQ